MMTSNKSASELVAMSANANEIVAQAYSADVATELGLLADESSTYEMPGSGARTKYVGSLDGVVWQVFLLGATPNS